MATITYGKGMKLLPTSREALREILEDSAARGHVEMPDVNLVDEFTTVVAHKGPVRMFLLSGGAQRGKSPVKPGLSAANLKVGVTATATATATGAENRAAKVVVDAPSVFEFFGKKRIAAS